MAEQFELIFGYLHCRGKTTYSAGYVATEEEAQDWVKRHQEGLCPPPKIPAEDPVRYCKAEYCPFKRQKPWFAYIKIPPRSAAEP